MIEWIIKLAGGAVITLACAQLGIYLAEKPKSRAAALTELKRAFLILRSETLFSAGTLEEAFRETSARAGGAVKTFLEKTAAALNKRDGRPLEKIWALEASSLTAGWFSEEDITQVKRLGGVLGCADVHMQAGAIDLLINYADDKISESNDIFEKNGRLYRSLGILGGLLITVVLI
jgi:stage III sporulation protein AB